MTNKKPTIYLSIDVETDGADITQNSCIMLGVAISKPLDEINLDENLDFYLEKKYWCIAKNGGTKSDDKTMNEFWSKNLGLLKFIQDNQLPFMQVQDKCARFIAKYNDEYEIKYVARPTSYDIPWVRLIDKDNLLSHTGICISTILKVCDYLNIDRELINELISNTMLPHTHYADDDAVQQLYMFLRLKKYLESKRLVSDV